MSHSRGQGNTLLISIAIFVLFALSNVMAEPAEDSIDGTEQVLVGVAADLQAP